MVMEFLAQEEDKEYCLSQFIHLQQIQNIGGVKMKKQLFIAILLSLGILLGGCAGPAEVPAAEAPAAEAPAAEVPAEEAPAAEEPAVEEPAELQTVTIAVGTYVLDASYPWLTLPVDLGFWNDLGYDVTPLPVGASLDGLQQLIGGNVEFAQMNAAVIIQANVNEGIPMRVVHRTGTVDWGLVVPTDSDITTLDDFKGRTIGVFSLASASIPLLRAYFGANGIDLDTEVDLLAVGFGAQANEALTSGDVDAIMLWNSGLRTLENMGQEFRFFRYENWLRMPDFLLSTTLDIFDENRQMAVDIVKGANMAIVFAKANPECAVKLHWEYWPETKPSDMDDAAALAWDIGLLNAQLDTIANAAALTGSDLMGEPTKPEWELLQEFLNDAGLLEADMLDPSIYYINDSAYWEEVNDFDHDQIIQMAEACDFDF
jgi:NitT/TauT family transport system substrate-binding protein